MKKIIYTVLILTGGALTANCQVSKGSIFLGGAVGMMSSGGETEVSGTSPSTTDLPQTTTIMFSPKAGFFVSDKIALGAQIDWMSRNTESTTGGVTTETKVSTFGFGLFGRYYISINDRFYFWPELGFGISSGSTEFESPSGNSSGPDLSGYNVGLGGGFSYFPSTRWGLDFSVGRLGISSMTSESTNTTTTPATVTETRNNNFDLFWDMRSVSLGLFVFFGGGGGGQ